jgi:hypothetical protein
METLGDIFPAFPKIVFFYKIVTYLQAITIIIKSTYPN